MNENKYQHKHSFCPWCYLFNKYIELEEQTDNRMHCYNCGWVSEEITFWDD